MSAFWMFVEFGVVVGLLGYVARRVTLRDVMLLIGEALPPRSHHDK